MKIKDKCCADCKHCVRHDISDYGCGKTGVRNRITGKYEYKKCVNVIDTPECEFEDDTKQRVAMFVITLVMGIGAAFLCWLEYIVGVNMTEHDIVAKAEERVKEWIDYAKQEYGWGDKVFELFEEPMIEVATAVAVQTTKDLQEENRKLLQSCEGATMMYKDLCKAKEHIENLLYYVKQCTCERSNYAEIKEDIKEAEQFLEGRLNG